MPIKVIIIGSGPTSLGAACRLRELESERGIDLQVSILEKESEVGGLARSVTDKRGFTWDLGVHVTGTSKYHRFLRFIDAAVQEWNEIPRCVKANMRHVLKNENPLLNYVPYPVQEAIPYFPEPEKSTCLAEVAHSASHCANEVPKNFCEFTRRAFGQTLQNLFIRPYNEKVWTVSLDDMNCEWVEGRVPRANLEQLRTRCSLPIEVLDHQEQTKPKVLFRYPKNLRGVGQMWRKISEFLPKHWMHFNKNVTQIDTKLKTVICADNSEFEYDYIISTMPIVELGRATSLAPQIQLKHSKVVLVGLGIRRPQPDFAESVSWAYFPQPKTVFYRCTFISNFNEHLTPNVALFWSLVCEIGLDVDADVDGDYLVEKTAADLTREGVLPEEAEIVDKWLHVLPYGYPIPTVNRDEELAKCMPLFEKNDIYSRGRFGCWKYEVANQDHSFTMGMEVVDKIFDGTPETVFKL